METITHKVETILLKVHIELHKVFTNVFCKHFMNFSKHTNIFCLYSMTLCWQTISDCQPTILNKSALNSIHKMGSKDKFKKLLNNNNVH
jgi:hypothetical protein